MYVNKCIKCGAEFETKNPKRVICPNCLYPDKSMMPSSGDSDQGQQQQNQSQEEQSFGGRSSDEQTNYERPQGGYSSGGYSAGGYSAGGYSSGGYDRPQRSNYNREGGYQSRGGYNSGRSQGGYQQRGGYQDRNQGGYSAGGYSSGGYDRPQRSNYNREGGYQSRGGYNSGRTQGGYSSGGYDRPQRSNYNREGGYQQRGGYNSGRPQGGFQQRRPSGPSRRPMGNRAPKPQKQLLISKEQLEQIEVLYKSMLPLPNPDAHEVIGEKLGLEPRKAFFGINLVRQKMMLPKLPFPKRRLAISPDQILAIKSLYEPLLPLPPIGCHKIIAIQLKMDEWRVHVGIGLIRSQMGLDRWNPDREDAPEEYKNKKKEEASEVSEVKEAKPKAKRATKSKKASEEAVAETEVAAEGVEEEKPVKKTRGRKPKKTDDNEE